MNKAFDVIIVGGGIIGNSIAYSLSKRGIHTLVIEKGNINNRATSAAAGMLAVQSEVTEDSPLYEIARSSRNMFPSLEKELLEITGINIELIQEGMLTIAQSEHEVEKLKAKIHFHQSRGESAHWVNPFELIKIEPHLSTSLYGAMYAPSDGQVSAIKIASAFAEGAKSLGASIIEHTEVTGFLTEKNQIVGVRTKLATYYSEKIVVTGGAWSDQILREARIDLGIYPVKGECFSVTTTESLLKKTIFGENCYLVPKEKNRIIVGATMTPHTYDERVSVKGIYHLLNRAVEILPKLETAKWEKVWAGIRPQTRDGLPYLGGHPEIKGLYVASGHYRNGILLSPITGELMAGCIEGKSNDNYLQEFSIKRREGKSEAAY